MARKTTRILGVCLVVVTTGAVVYELFLDPREERTWPPPAMTRSATAASTPSPPVPAAVSAPSAFAITELVGTLEVRRGDTWHRLKLGDRLGATDVVRTGPDGRAVLRDAAGTELSLRERVELEVRELTRTAVSLSLTAGKMRAAPAPENEQFTVASHDSRTQASGGSRFTIFADERGAVAVAADVGTIKVTASGQTVTVGPNAQTIVQPGGKPEDPIPVPTEVFLAVTWPEDVVQGAQSSIEGKVKPGTMVTLNGQPVRVQIDGSFRVPVTLKDGDNLLEVAAESMGGVLKVVHDRVTLHPAGPPVTVDPSRMYDPPVPPSP